MINNLQGLWNKKGAIALIASMALLAACETNQPQATTPTSPGNVTTEQVANQTEALLGKTVTVRSEPVQKISDSAFTISDEQFFSNENILVVNTSGKPFALPENTEVQVTGQVAKLVVADVNREYNLGLEPNLYVEYEGRPVIYAQSIALAPEPGEITQNPSRYYGQTLAVTGEVEDIVDANSFTLDEDQLLGAEDLLVINANPTAAVTDGETVAVTGVLRPFVVADIEREYDLTWDLDLQRKLEAEYSQKPVLVADGVYPSAIPEAAK
ncbi:hypothetical protein [Gloeocapsopsis dulcis]|uniref:Uncharacterized protein n=1 Tax=Gloeocapsopsis dulcis AAB1 = 1H9 TaxID=1433147 RepID=A0A6N8FW41_9CHRO|nr:hypothetical protein [Gloeocapsopsis dulcis]MUL36377.1 hypothetical protein [Gloeocapsopsis dulcis AAB1 = 1H9]WNN88127.1 hypothetical protein P0S91_17745 [Gloeocapsopsis dulcis]